MSFSSTVLLFKFNCSSQSGRKAQEHCVLRDQVPRHKPAENTESLNPHSNLFQTCPCLWVGAVVFSLFTTESPARSLTPWKTFHVYSLNWDEHLYLHLLKKEADTPRSWAACLGLQGPWEMEQELRNRLPMATDPTLRLLPRAKGVASPATKFFFLWTKAGWLKLPLHCSAWKSKECAHVCLCPLVHVCVGGFIKDIAVFSKLHLLIVRRFYISGNLSLGTFLWAWSFCPHLDNCTHPFTLTGILNLKLTKTIPLNFQKVAFSYKLGSPWLPSKVNILMSVRPSLLELSCEKHDFSMVTSLSSLGVRVGGVPSPSQRLPTSMIN